MPLETHTKMSVAQSQLDTALRLFAVGEHIAAITLAGAAEEILGRAVEQQGGTPALTLRRNAVEAMHLHLFNSAMGEKWFAARANRARNALKHFNSADDSTISINAQEEAADMLTRAIDNYWQLTSQLSPAMEDFERAQRNTS